MARWMLVLLLATDQIGSPLHHHHHDSGIDGTWSSEAADHHASALASDLESHIEDVDHDDHFSHATLAVRTTSEAARVFSSPVTADDAVAIFHVVAALTLLTFVEEARPLTPPGWRSPFISVYRSLPPAGRAPPFHA